MQTHQPPSKTIKQPQTGATSRTMYRHFLVSQNQTKPNSTHYESDSKEQGNSNLQSTKSEGTLVNSTKPRRAITNLMKSSSKISPRTTSKSDNLLETTKNSQSLHSGNAAQGRRKVGLPVNKKVLEDIFVVSRNKVDEKAEATHSDSANSDHNVANSVSIGKKHEHVSKTDDLLQKTVTSQRNRVCKLKTHPLLKKVRVMAKEKSVASAVTLQEQCLKLKNKPGSQTEGLDQERRQVTKMKKSLKSWRGKKLRGSVRKLQHKISSSAQKNLKNSSVPGNVPGKIRNKVCAETSKVKTPEKSEQNLENVTIGGKVNQDQTPEATESKRSGNDIKIKCSHKAPQKNRSENSKNTTKAGHAQLSQREGLMTQVKGMKWIKKRKAQGPTMTAKKKA